MERKRVNSAHKRQTVDIRPPKERDTAEAEAEADSGEER